MRALTLPRWLAAVLVGGASFTLYLITLAPTMTWANFGTDGGDLITAAATLGIPHPPGYPLYTTLGYGFAQLPIGPVAFRLNLFSAGCMALAAALIAWSVPPTPALLRSQKDANGGGSWRSSPVDEKRSTGLGVSILAGLAFAAAPLVWGQATIAEVHALNALLVAAMLALLAPGILYAEAISTRRLAVACWVWGLSLTHQLTALALAPVFFIAIRRSTITHHSSLVTRHAVRLTPYALLFFLPLSLYLLLLLRAAAQPPVNWLGEATLANWWSLITARIYRGYAFGVPLSDYPARLVALAQMLIAQFGWLGVGLMALGLYRNRQRVSAPVMSAALYGVFALGYNTVDSQLYLIPVWLLGAYALAAGAHALTQYASRFTHHASLVTRHALRLAYCAVLIFLIPGLSVINHFTAQDLRADRRAEVFAQTILTAAPHNALIVTHLDAHTFTLWYYRLVEGQRLDVAIIDARLAAYPWYDPMLRAQDARRAQNAQRAQHQSLIEVDFDPEETWLARLRAANPARPLCDLDPVTAQLACQP